MATRFPGSPFFRPLSTTADLQLSTINHVLVDPTVGAEILYLSTIINVLVDSTVAAKILYLSTINNVLVDSTVAAEILKLSTMFELICVTSDQTALHHDLFQLGFKS